MTLSFDYFYLNNQLSYCTYKKKGKKDYFLCIDLNNYQIDYINSNLIQDKFVINFQ